MRAPTILLPSTYYHSHFCEVLGFVASVYGVMLSDEDRAFLGAFQALSPDAQYLYVRMINRKRTSFSIDDLSYEEIEGREEGLADLFGLGFSGPITEADYAGALYDLTKADLLSLARGHGLPEVKSTVDKPRLVERIRAELPFADFMACEGMAERIVPAHRETVAFFLYLYFGKLSETMTNFALRDLGIRSVKQREAYSARFQDEAEARAGFTYARLLGRLKSAAAGEIDALLDAVPTLPAAETDYTCGLRERLLMGLGQALEKRKDMDLALKVYALASGFEVRLRQVRILYAEGAHERVQELLDAMMARAEHDEEFVFASDFWSRKYGGKRTGIFSDLLGEAETIEADDLYRGFPEAAACRHFEAEGWTCHHTENALWSSVFGLIFWDELFEGAGALNCGFDLVPQSLRNRSFHLTHAQAIKARLQAIEAGRGAELIATNLERHEGEANGLFNWNPELIALLPALLQLSPPVAISRLLGQMAEDYYGLRDGFPDLMLTKDGALRFIEIKAEGDVIRRHQVARLNLLKSLGLEVGICRLTYRPDPNQTYVVVDVETTGGRAANDRITEIGAVKVQDGKVIAEWHSLINPGRHIPAFITQITGITDTMVKDAPSFAEIADQFEAFLNGSVFVAHNVNFDYGFIGQEYRRLERRFSYPKLCTCASMRKYYPGHQSYGLGPLCEDFRIRLENHHRALDDARAAAELLHLIMDNRRLRS